MSEKKYGFITEEYDDGSSIDTLVTGDGKTQFTDMNHPDGLVGIGMSYGLGKGINTVIDYPPGTLAPDVGVKWSVKFECVESIDAMIDTLNRCKSILISNQDA